MHPYKRGKGEELVDFGMGIMEASIYRRPHVRKQLMFCQIQKWVYPRRDSGERACER